MLLQAQKRAHATGKFAFSGLRVSGLGSSARPTAVKHFVVLRAAADKRSAWLRWALANSTYAYNIYTGPAPDKLYSCLTIEAINENGIPSRKAVSKAARSR